VIEYSHRRGLSHPLSRRAKPPSAHAFVGYDSEDKVSEEYTAPYAFTDGTILGVAVDIGDDVYLDLEKEAAAVMARD